VAVLLTRPVSWVDQASPTLSIATWRIDRF